MAAFELMRVKGFVIEHQISVDNETKGKLFRLMIFPIDNMRGGINRHRMLKQTDWFPLENLADYLSDCIILCYESGDYKTNRAWN